MGDQELHYGKPDNWLKIDGIWYEKVNSGFIRPVSPDHPELLDNERADIKALKTRTEHVSVEYFDIIKFRKSLCRRILEDYVPDRPPDEEEIVESYVAVGNCPAMVDDYRFFPYSKDSREWCECIALFDIFSSIRNPEEYLKSMAYGQRLVVTVNLIPTDIWTRIHNWKRRANILEYWIYYQKGMYQTYFNKVGFAEFLRDNGFEVLFEMDHEEKGMGEEDSENDELPDKPYPQRLNAFSFAAIKVVET
jgi:hypothetical protein